MKVLIEFRHGLGDAVMFTAVLRHLRHYRPEWIIDVATSVGKHTCFAGLCRTPLIIGRDKIRPRDYHQHIVLQWPETRGDDMGDMPSTKTTRSLRDVFKVAPLPELLHYQISPSPAVQRSVRSYLATALSLPLDQPRFPVACIHYQGNSSQPQKDLSHETGGLLVDEVMRHGRTPLILDWDCRSPHISRPGVLCPGAGDPIWGGTGTGDAGAIAALISLSELCVGIDSGPLHCAAATTTPTIAIWTRNHPVHFMDLADNLHHFVPKDHRKMVAGERSYIYFRHEYRHHEYDHLEREVMAGIGAALSGHEMSDALAHRSPPGLHAVSYDRSYYDEHRLSGLDYLGYGDWQLEYGRWLVAALNWNGRRVLDVGCACGSVMRGIGAAGAVVAGVDVSEYMIGLGRQTWPDMAGLLHTCDAANLHLWRDGEWDGIHCAQAAEHFKPELVPFILRELARVTRPGGLLWLCLDTQELYDRQGRNPEDEDPTHVCIKPRSWWWGELIAAGWHPASAPHERRLSESPQSFLKRYDWDWIIAERGGKSP